MRTLETTEINAVNGAGFWIPAAIVVAVVVAIADAVLEGYNDAHKEPSELGTCDANGG